MDCLVDVEEVHFIDGKELCDRRREAASSLALLLEKDVERESVYKALWECIRLYQGEMFCTSGRGKRPGVQFVYHIKVSNRTGEETEELLVSRKANSKSITKSTVCLGFENALSEQRENGCVKGPKKLAVFGASYLYAVFLRLGVISR